jgi:predicted HicB family RNase H-like nuclease
MIIKKNKDNNSKSKMLIRMDEELSIRVREAAKEDLRSVNSFVAFAVRSYIDSLHNREDKDNIGASLEDN